MKNISILSLILIISLNSFSAIVPKNIAEKAALNFIKSYNLKKGIDINNIQISETYPQSYNNEVVYYAVVFNNDNFVYISADDAAYPIIGFSTENIFDKEQEAINHKVWMLQYAKSINEIREKNIPSTAEITSKWNTILTSSSKYILESKSATPLLISKWNQDSKYNALCPVDADGPGGRVYAGCVAIAMGQIMYYYRYPNFGTGSHTYYHNTYGSLSANFDTTNYKWSLMQNYMPNSGNHEIAQLLYHLGVSVDMGYSASGSGAMSYDAADALKSNFGYQSSVTLKNKNNYSDTEWANMLTTSLDSGIPLYYHGYDSNWGSGHAFNLDGYEGNDHFHFNWGWSGSYNAYYYLPVLNPGGNDFASGQGAIFNIYPANNYPEYCNANQTLLTEEAGTFADGSGPSNYLSNSSCEWLIQPNQNIENIKITFDRFSLSTDDTLFIYDGPNTSSPILAKYTGAIIPSPLTSNNSTILLKLISNSNNEEQGFDISYKSNYPVYCNIIKFLTDSIGSIKDGSGTNNYNSSTFCKWSIEPSGSNPIKLTFDSFDTEANVDIVKVFDPASSPSVLLGEFSGNNIPPSIISPSGEMLIIFITNDALNKSGWSAHYISGPSVGINNIRKQDNYTVSPNPNNGIFSIKSNNNLDIYSIKVVNLDGKLVKTIERGTHSSNITNIDLSNVAKGVYLIKIQEINRVSTKKIIII